MTKVINRRYKWIRVKVSRHFYLGVRLFGFLPLFAIRKENERTVDEFFKYLTTDICWAWEYF